MKHTSSFCNLHPVCVRLGSIITKIRRIRGDPFCRETLQRLRRRAAIIKLAFPVFSAVWSQYVNLLSFFFPARGKRQCCPLEQAEQLHDKSQHEFRHPSQKTSCFFLSCFIKNTRGLKNILTHHVSLLTLQTASRKTTCASWMPFLCVIMCQTRVTATALTWLLFYNKAKGEIQYHKHINSKHSVCRFSGKHIFNCMKLSVVH